MGKPTTLSVGLRSEFIGAYAGTRGTETSKYPEENKYN